MNTRKTVLALSAIGFAGYGVGRWHAGLEHRRPSTQAGPVVATIGGGPITEGDLRALLDQAPILRRQHLALPENRKQLLEELLRRELLAAEAINQGLDQDPQVTAATKEALANRILEKELGEGVIRQELSDDELRGYYQRHLADYSRPERLRLAHIFVAKPAGDAAAVEAKRKLSKEILAEVRKGLGDPYGFGRSARSRSEDLQTR